MFFAWPWSPDQPTEVWALAKIRFYFKPRRRIWDQSGVKELVTITVPKREEKVYTNGLTQTEVNSRLKALADTIDSRGWVIKNSNINLSAANVIAPASASDRLIDYSHMPQEVPENDILAADDIFDDQNSPVAQQFDQMMQNSAQQHRQQLISKLTDDQQPPAAPPTPSQGSAQPPNDYWFMHQTTPDAQAPKGGVMFNDPQVVQPGITATDTISASSPQDEQVLAEALKSRSSAQDASNAHLKTIDPAGPKPTPVPDAVTQDLARNNDLNVATLAREAKKAHEPKLPPDDEVVIPLH
jgi:hypothetical protein